jgi:dihydrofolate synthase/folylpolyglutamate synthase
LIPFSSTLEARPFLDTLTDYTQRLTAFFQLRRFGKERSLAPLRQLLAELGHPERGLLFIHIVGTNGKGSTASMLASILEEAGLRVGLFTSPHLVHFEERFRVQGQPLGWRLVNQQLQRVLQAQAKQDEPGLFFDMTTALGVCLFAHENVDVVVLEAGIGGELDATAVLPSSLVILTNVGRDHISVLGGSPASVTAAKAGAAQSSVPFVSGPLSRELQPLARKVALSKDASFVWEAGNEWRSDVETGATQTFFTLKTPKHHWETLPVMMPGPFQRQNAAMAAVAASALLAAGWSLTEENVREGLTKARWFGRWQQGYWNDRPILVDGAHNVSALSLLLEELEEKRPHLVFSCMQGKESPLMIEAMQGKIASLTLFALPQERVEPVTRLAALAEQLLPELPRLNADSLQEAMDRVVNSVSAEEMVVLCGSLFVWEALLQQNEFRLVESLTFERR